MANIRKILTVGGAAMGAAFALYTNSDIMGGLCYAVAGSGVAPLGIAFGKLLIRGVAEMFEKSPPESCQLVREDIVTIFSVGIFDLVEAPRHDLLEAPNTLVFRTLFAAGSGNFTPYVTDVIEQAFALEAERDRVRP